MFIYYSDIQITKGHYYWRDNDKKDQFHKKSWDF
jgi:hypothetical protein